MGRTHLIEISDCTISICFRVIFSCPKLKPDGPQLSECLKPPNQLQYSSLVIKTHPGGFEVIIYKTEIPYFKETNITVSGRLF